MKPIILASASPRRQELLAECSIPFSVLVTDIDESVDQPLPAEVYVSVISRRKAEAAAAICGANGQFDITVLAADTAVSIDDKIMGKPKDKNDAFNMLKQLSGRQHSVYTGLTFAYLHSVETIYKQKVCRTYVQFKDLSDKQIWDYISTGEPFDKAGSYAIQGIGGALIESIDGDYNNVVGLPTNEVLKELGLII